MTVERTPRSSPSPLAHALRASEDLSTAVLSFWRLEREGQNWDGLCRTKIIRLQDKFLCCDHFLEGVVNVNSLPKQE